MFAGVLLGVGGVAVFGAEGEATPPSLGWLTLVPPVLAIALAILFRQVVPALLAGVWVGAWIGYGGPVTGALRTLDQYVVGALADRDRISIIVFSLLLGGMVGLMSRSGGTRGLVDLLSRHATNRRRGQFVTWLLGLVVFFDDYANTLVVGNTMRPVTDRLRISREKLAYIVDSTAAPVAAVALISTWIGFEVSLISDALADVGSSEDAYWIFVQAIPYCFYPLLALAFVAMIALSGRDFGPMLRAERRALDGKLIADGSVPLTNFEHPALAPDPDRPARWINAAVPVAAVLLVTFVSQLLSGRAALAADGLEVASGFEGFGTTFSKGNSFNSLLYASATGCVVAFAMARAQGILGMGAGLLAWIEGMKSMFLAFVILTLAWAIGDVCRDLGTAGYVAEILEGRIDPRLLPLLIFVLAALIAFSTGSSWSTMTILIPIAVPSAFALAQAAGYGPSDLRPVLLGAVSSVLAGAIFGDHCSPISDTTVLSSMASGSDHVDHVRTQLPYAIVVAVVAMVLGSIPGGFGISPWISLAAGGAALWLVLRLLGRRTAAAT
jgi:Na+/H+ antiporter NhaC